MAVWRCATYTELEQSLDYLTTSAWAIELFTGWDTQDPLWGAVFRTAPRTVDTAMVIIHVDEALVPECSCPDHEDTA